VEAVLGAAGLRMFHLDLAAVPADSALGHWLTEPHLLGGQPVSLPKTCKGIIFVETAN
jgi:hypothetical protein